MQQQVLRTPIVSILGHVDHGKTTLLDKIRKTRVVSKEAGGITQHIGATEIPVEAIQEICKDIWNVKVDIPGLLFIDTPGHRAFTNLRKRGGALADLAILIIDINESFKPQTEEALTILKTARTPFIVAANKIDRTPGWQPSELRPVIKSLAEQEDFTRDKVNNRVYELIADLYSHGLSADRFDKINDFTKTVAIIPVSAKTGEGVPELLMILLGLAQRFLEDNLRLHVGGKAKGTILEVKEEKGIGMTCDIILHDGTLHVGDKMVIAGIEDAIVTHVKGILKPPSIKEMRVESKFKGVSSISAAAGVKITAPHLENVLAGSEFEVVEKEEDINHFKERVRKEYEDIVIKTDEEGIVVKTDTLGSLEALINELKSSNVPIKKAEVGPVNKRDVVEANANKNELNKAILVFGVKVLPGVGEEASRYGVRFFRGDIIYNIMDEYLKWREEEERQREKQKVEALIKPAKIQLLKDFIFRRNKPAVIGVRIFAGELKKGVKLMQKDGSPAGTVKSIQKGGENVNSASEGEEVAVAIEGVTIGRQLQGDEELLIDIPEKHAKIIERDLLDTLTQDVQEVFKELVELKRQENPFWGK